VVIVIDVIRAFTTAAAAFVAGAERILCVETLEQAAALRDRLPGAVLMGETEGRRPPGFDLGNSPVEVAAASLDGAVVVQRTSNGTRGLAAAWIADAVVAAAATNVTATARWVSRHHGMAAVTALCTGDTAEDISCAHHLGGLLAEGIADTAELAAGVRAGAQEHMALWRDPRAGKHDGFMEDVEVCSDVDRYDFAMVGRRSGLAIELRMVRD
jgi:2-phosphosulfolactate phosphatase